MVGKLILFIVGATYLFQDTQPKVILFFGDSLTAGYGLSPEEAFPAVVEKNLQKSGAPVRIINAGLSGETSAGGLSRIDWVLRQPIDVFVLELGANDGLRGLPIKDTRKNLQTIIDKVKVKYPKCKIVLAGMMVAAVGSAVSLRTADRDYAATARATARDTICRRRRRRCRRARPLCWPNRKSPSQ